MGQEDIEQYLDEELSAYQRPYRDEYRFFLENGNRWLADEILDSIFLIYWNQTRAEAKAKAEYDDELGGAFARWRHRTHHDLPEDLRSLQIDGDMLRYGVSIYLDNPSLHTRYLDWFCIDTLIYAEYFGTYQAFQARLVGLSGSLAEYHGGIWPSIAAVWRLVWSGVKWLGWIFALAWIWTSLDEPLNIAVLIPLLVLTITSQYQLIKARKKMRGLLTEMATVYGLTKTQNFSWNVIWQELGRTRELGAVWPGELYRLIEMKKTN